MRKAKIMLSAIGLLSLVGGMLAFKAQHRNGLWRCGTTSTYCPNIAFTTVVGAPNAYCTLAGAAVNTVCIFTRARIDD